METGTAYSSRVHGFTARFFGGFRVALCYYLSLLFVAYISGLSIRIIIEPSIFINVYNVHHAIHHVLCSAYHLPSRI